MCSIKTTNAIGAIAKIAVAENLGKVSKSFNASPEKPIQFAAAIGAKSTNPKKIETIYPRITDIKIGTNLKNDFSKIEIVIIEITTIRATIRLF